MAVAACSDDRARARPPSPDELPEFELVTGGRTTLGLKLGTRETERVVSPFRITRYPITVRRYKQCLAAGACERPTLASFHCQVRTGTSALLNATFDLPDGDELPVTCLMPEQATNYCRWVGGTLPSSTQWLAAARGPNVRRYSWGNKVSECDQHARVRIQGRACSIDSTSEFAVGKHPRGAAPTGVQDVLLASAELIAPSRDSFFPACAGATGTCLVTGLDPGAIDSISATPPMSPSTRKTAESALVPLYGFRCVSETP